jgi:UDPglucose 6-dehydrogenase
MDTAKTILNNVELADDMYDCINSVDVLIIVTEWEEFKKADLVKVKNLMKTPLIIDGRNIFDPCKIRALGFDYDCIGKC